jgi:hypothetical protein
MGVKKSRQKPRKSSPPVLQPLGLIFVKGDFVRAPGPDPIEAAEPPPEDPPPAKTRQGLRLLPGFEGDQAPLKEPRGRGRPRGSKDLAPRSRRTRAEMERSRNPRQRLFYS